MDEELRINCFKALACLYIAVEAPIADDINAKIKAYITVEEAKVAKLEGWLKLIARYSWPVIREDIKNDSAPIFFAEELSAYIKAMPKD